MSETGEVNNAQVRVPAWCPNRDSWMWGTAYRPAGWPRPVDTPCEEPAKQVNQLILLSEIVISKLVNTPRKICPFHNLSCYIISDAIKLWGYLVKPDKAAAIVKAIIDNGGEIRSFIKNKSTAELLSQFFGVKIPMNRGKYEPDIDDLVMVVKPIDKFIEQGMDMSQLTIDYLTFGVYRYGWKEGYQHEHNI